MPSKNAENCEHAKAAPRAIIDELPESQAGAGRHKCAVCAFRAGYAAAVQDAARAFRSTAPEFLAVLEEADAP